MASLARLGAIAAALAWMGSPQAAKAAEWWFVSEVEDSVIFFDRASVTPTTVGGRALVGAWEWNFEKLDSGQYVSRSKTLNLWSCRDRSYASRSYISYEDDGTLGPSETVRDSELEYDFVAPGTVGETQMNFVCNAGRGAGETTRFSIGDREFFWVEDPEAVMAELGEDDADEARPANAPPSGAATAGGPKSSGSSFFVNAAGFAVTNAHVVEGCARIVSPRFGDLRVVAVDEVSDLALLKAAQTGTPFVRMRPRNPRLGEAVVAAGFPLTTLLGNGIRVTNGNVSALSGLGGDRTHFQLSAPIQPGNSGGPVLDGAGDLIGVVAAKLDEMKVALAGGGLPQNVNFAVTGSVLQSFLDENGVQAPPAAAAGAARAGPSEFTFLVQCVG